MSNAQLIDQVALVTGGGRGIGRAAALALAEAGAHVAVAARTTTEIDAVAAELRQLGRKAIALPIDLAAEDSVATVVQQVTAELGPITILVNNAAIVGPFGATWELDPQDWVKALTVNLVAPFRLAHAVLPEMLRRGWGRIINVSSGAARSPIERTGAYSTSKAGIDMLTQQLGVELEGSGVTAVCVYPGVVDTTMQTAIRSQPAAQVGAAVAQRFQTFYESGQLQDPARPGRLIAKLAADPSRNGQIVNIYSEEAQALIDADER